MNKQLGNGQMAAAKEDYLRVTAQGGCASDCIECHQCEEACPQHLPITEHLKKASVMFRTESK